MIAQKINKLNLYIKYWCVEKCLNNNISVATVKKIGKN